MSALRCPVCKSDLTAEAKRYICANNHSFDIARQGYVNLLLSSQMASKHPGDSAEMLSDRHDFLEAGFYRPLRDRIAELLSQLQDGRTAQQTILDLGCGEGYYTATMTAPNRSVYGLDIAKPALVMAAKRTRDIPEYNLTWCVGTSRSLPFHDHSLDIVTNIFCRPHLAEIRRVLCADGNLVIVSPGPNHLRELREKLYETVKEETIQQNLEDFVLINSETLHYEFTASNEHLLQLARMTPHYWRAPQSRRETLESVDALTLHTEFVISIFKPGINND